MKRRDFLKSSALGGLAISNANALNFTKDDRYKMRACHFGAFYAKASNDRFDNFLNFEEDLEPSTTLQGILARSYDKTRVKYPAVRKSFLQKRHLSDRNLRGKEEFVEVSWDVALDLVADELKRVYKEWGPNSIFGGSFGWHCVGMVNHPEILLARMLNVAGGFVDKTLSYSRHAIRAVSPYITTDESDAAVTSWENLLKHTDVFVFWGNDMFNTNQVSRLVPDHESYEYLRKLKAEAKKRDIKFICIDPVYNETAKYFNATHIPINPGSDTALMFGISNYLVSNNLHNQEFLDRYTVGSAEFIEYLKGSDGTPKTPKWASDKTGIDEEIIIDLAKLFSSKSTMLMAGWSIQRSFRGEQAVWGIIALASILGQIGTKGGGYGFGYQYSEGGVPSAIGTTTPNLEQISKTPKFDGPWKGRKNISLPVSRIVDCIENPGLTVNFNGKKLTYPNLKLCYWSGGNPFVHHQNTNRMVKAWENLETFIVNECFWTPTARMADIVLPATTEQERNDITKSFTKKYIMAMHKISDPYCGAKDDYEIFSEIMRRFSDWHHASFTENKTKDEWIMEFYQNSYDKAKKNGVDMPSFDEFWYKTGYAKFEPLESSINYIKMGDFIKDPVANKLKTPSGKIEIKSDTIAQMGYSDCKGMPTWYDGTEKALTHQKPKSFHSTSSLHTLNTASTLS